MLAEADTVDSAVTPVSLRSCIQKVATGPEYSKNLTYEEAYDAMRAILADQADPVQAAVFLIALRMKRETDDENRGVLQAIIDVTDTRVAEVDELLDIADPYDGYTRGLPASPFLAPLLAACGIPSVSHGLESVGPKYGITHRMVLQAAGVDVNTTPETALTRLAEAGIGWSYIDQRTFCPSLHNLVDLRTRIVKRPVITTVEVLVGPVRARKQTHLLTGYVHKAYPARYAALARHAGFDSALIVRGVEGGVIPSISQAAKIYSYRDRGEENPFVVEPESIGIRQDVRAVPIPDNIPPAPSAADDIASTINVEAAAALTAELGIAALEGQTGPMKDSLIYAGAITLRQLGRYSDLQQAAEAVKKAIDSGSALARLRAA